MTNWDRAPFLFADDIMEDAHKLQRGIAITVLNNLQILSPVDEGRYRANHIVSFGSPDYRYTENKDGMSVAFNAIQSMSSTELPMVYIQNNLPYAERIENGWSKQAPQGVYSLAYEAAVAAYT
ncbi:HK97 gp10 family phage protein [Psychrobacter sp. Arc29]|uniref:HK97 gp10 family phage protein n=1 Tax=Psychrobacter sp. Arc29 TaxID=3046690 RepID=UPI00352E3FF2